MKAITITTGGNVESIELARSNTLEQLQGAVSGLIEAVDISDSVTMWVNEEGKFNGSDQNYLATLLWESKYGKTDVIFGDVIITGGSNQRGNTLGLSAKDQTKVMKVILTLVW